MVGRGGERERSRYCGELGVETGGGKGAGSLQGEEVREQRAKGPPPTTVLPAVTV